MRNSIRKFKYFIIIYYVSIHSRNLLMLFILLSTHRLQSIVLLLCVYLFRGLDNVAAMRCECFNISFKLMMMSSRKPQDLNFFRLFSLNYLHKHQHGWFGRRFLSSMYSHESYLGQSDRHRSELETDDYRSARAIIVQTSTKCCAFSLDL